jgi:cytochrome c551
MLIQVTIREVSFMNKLAVLLLGLILVLPMSACNRNNNGAPDANPPASSPAASPGAPAASPSGSPVGSPGASPSGSVDAQAIYKQNCIACHAADLRGGVGPNLQKVGARMSADQIAAKITAGGGGMTAFKGVLTDAQIHSLADWLSTHK